MSEVKRLKPLEDENGKLKELLAEQMLGLAAVRELASKKVVMPAVKRSTVAHLKARFGLPERRACRITGAARLPPVLRPAAP